MSTTINSKIYFNVFLGLIILTILTIAQPFVVDLDIASTVAIQMFFATLKASLIVLYYMHLKYESSLYKGFFIFAFFALSVLFVLILSDMLFRGKADDIFSSLGVVGGLLC